MNPYFYILRPNVVFLSVIGLFAGFTIGNFPINWTCLLIAMSVFTLTGAGNVINDVMDYKIDAINRPNRVIPSGLISRKNAVIYFLFLMLLGNTFSYFVSPYFFIFQIIGSIILSIYSLLLKRIALIGNIAVAYLSCSCILASYAAYFETSPVNNALLIFLLVSFLGTFSREIIKDIEDIHGDSIQGAKTLPIITSPFFARSLANILLIMASVALIQLSYLPIKQPIYFPTLIPFYLLVMLSFFFNPKIAQTIIKIAIFLLLFIILSGHFFTRAFT